MRRLSVTLAIRHVRYGVRVCPLAVNHRIDLSLHRRSGALHLVSSLCPLAVDHRIDWPSHRPSGTFELDSTLLEVAGGSGVESVTLVQPTDFPIGSSTKQSHSSTSLKCIQLNARSLNNKFLSFHKLIDSDSYDIIVFTESWLRPNITEGFIDLRNKYNIFRHDLVGRQGGGVCKPTGKCLDVVQVQFTENIDAVCLDINISSSNYSLIAAYRLLSATSNDVD